MRKSGGLRTWLSKQNPCHASEKSQVQICRPQSQTWTPMAVVLAFLRFHRPISLQTTETLTQTRWKVEDRPRDSHSHSNIHLCTDIHRDITHPQSHIHTYVHTQKILHTHTLTHIQAHIHYTYIWTLHTHTVLKIHKYSEVLES